jgi:hypothetical protein
MPHPAHPTGRSRLNRAANSGALILASFLAAIGVLRLLAALISREALPLRPVDGWFLMSLRILAVLFALGMARFSRLRRRYTLLLLALVMLTTASLWQRLGSLLPLAWQPTAGMAQLLMSVLGLSFIIAGLAQGEDLVQFIQESWTTAFARPPSPPPAE